MPRQFSVPIHVARTHRDLSYPTAPCAPNVKSHQLANDHCSDGQASNPAERGRHCESSYVSSKHRDPIQHVGEKGLDQKCTELVNEGMHPLCHSRHFSQVLDPSCPFSSPVLPFGVVVFLSVTSLSTVQHASSSLPNEGRERDLMLSRSATTRSRPQRMMTGRGYIRTGSFADAETPRVPLSVSLCFSRDGMTPSFSSTFPSCLFYSSSDHCHCSSLRIAWVDTPVCVRRDSAAGLTPWRSISCSIHQMVAQSRTSHCLRQALPFRGRVVPSSRREGYCS